ncbi:Ig-like domain-containing protein, partial [Candidatus Saccharibacteria bacterium]|nr:Ig-like domain-containing protein [Candidatus Saccharibacteria bacterium]
KNTIMYAIIGLVVTLAAFAITEFILGALEGRAPEGGGTHAEEGGGGGGSGGGGGGGSEGGGGGGSSDSEEVPVKSIQMSSKTSLIEEDSMQITLKIIPDYATDHTVTFSSSDEKTATVSKTGLLKAKQAGQATITAKAENGVTATMAVTVLEKIKVSTIKLNPANLSIEEKKSARIEAEVLPANAADKTLEWSSSDKTIATVNNDGLVKAVKPGKATITAKSSNNITAKATVTITEKDNGYTSKKGSLTAEQRKKIVEFSKTQLGVSYNYGPGGQCGGGLWDNDIPNQQLACNGLTRWAYHAAGVTIPKGSENQMRNAPVVTSTGKVSDMTPGDIIVWDPEGGGPPHGNGGQGGRRNDVPKPIRNFGYGHVAIYIGNNKFIEATCPIVKTTDIHDNEYSYSLTW